MDRERLAAKAQSAWFESQGSTVTWETSTPISKAAWLAAVDAVIEESKYPQLLAIAQRIKSWIKYGTYFEVKFVDAGDGTPDERLVCLTGCIQGALDDAKPGSIP